MFFLARRIFRRKAEKVTVDPGKTTPGTRDPEKPHPALAHSLFVRVVDTGSCNACEVEIAGLGNPYRNLERYGIKIVASPKHADVLLVTGCVTRNMLIPLKRAWGNVPAPRFVVTLGDCTGDRCPFKGTYAVEGPVSRHLPVHLHIPGCPPRPEEIIAGLLKLKKLIRE